MGAWERWEGSGRREGTVRRVAGEGSEGRGEVNERKGGKEAKEGKRVEGDD